MRAIRRVLPKATGEARREPLPLRLAGVLIALAFGGFAFFLRVLPADVALELGALGGTVSSWLVRSRRGAARGNLLGAFPEKTHAERDRHKRAALPDLRG